MGTATSSGNRTVGHIARLLYRKVLGLLKPVQEETLTKLQTGVFGRINRPVKRGRYQLRNNHERCALCGPGGHHRAFSTRQRTPEGVWIRR